MKLNFKDRFKVLMSGHIEDFLSGNDIQNTSAKVSIDTAMKYTAVNACIRVRAETFASVPFMLYKKTADGREIVKDDPIYDILHFKPNEEMSPFNFKETLLTNFDTSGNSVSKKLVNKKGELVGLYPYPHNMVKIERDKETKRLIYVIGSGTDQETLTRDEVFHVPNESFDGVIGLSPIEYTNKSIELGLSYEQFGVSFYKNGAMTSGVFEHPNALNAVSHANLKKSLKINYQGLRNAGVPMILEEGMKYTPMSIKPVDAELLQSKYYQIEEICRIFRVPPHLVQDLRRSTNNNIEHQSLEFVMYTMLPIFKRFEDNFNMQILSRKQRKEGYYVEAKIDSLLRGDSKSRADAYSVGRQWGWLSVNDIRRLENQKPIPNGDIYLEPLNYDEAGVEGGEED